MTQNTSLVEKIFGDNFHNKFKFKNIIHLSTKNIQIIDQEKSFNNSSPPIPKDCKSDKKLTNITADENSHLNDVNSSLKDSMNCTYIEQVSTIPKPIIIVQSLFLTTLLPMPLCFFQKLLFNIFVFLYYLFTEQLFTTIFNFIKLIIDFQDTMAIFNGFKAINFNKGDLFDSLKENNISMPKSIMECMIFIIVIIQKSFTKSKI